MEKKQNKREIVTWATGPYVIKGTENQVAKMKQIWSRETYWTPEAKKFFEVWNSGTSGIYMFPKRRYFESYNGSKDYDASFKKHLGISYQEYLDEKY